MASSSCRVCLGNGAFYPIFESYKSEESIHGKFLHYFKEQLEDIKGYPRNICLNCSNTLNSLCDFISKFRESQKILESGLLIVKEEDSDHSGTEPEYLSEKEIEVKIDKEEINFINFKNNQLLDLLEPLSEVKKDITFLPNIQNKIHKEPIEEAQKKNEKKNRSSKIASSILEGEFTWNGENWCLKSTQLKIPRDKNVKHKRRDTRLKLPRKKSIPQQTLCDICGATFKTKYKLKLHRRKAHNENPVNCPHCSKICNTEYNLSRHIKRQHSNQRDHVCATCGQAFVYLGELNKHIRSIHNKLFVKKTYSCKYCDKTYKSQKSVVLHERSAHTGERPAVCLVCTKGFYHEDYLKEHMRLHTGEVPFKCPVCLRGYAQRGNMKSHLRNHRISEIDPITLSKMKPNYIKFLKKC